MLLALLPLAGWAAAADLIKSPALASGLIYDKTAQTLLTGEATLPPNYQITPGCVLYQVTSTTTAPDQLGAELVGVATTEFPKATNAGKYYVWYKVKADGGDYMDDGAWTLVDDTYKYVRISSATPTITDPTPENLTYNGGFQSLLKDPGSTTFGTLKYRLNGEGDWIEWSNEDFATTIKGLNAVHYTVNLKVAADDENATPNWVEATKDFDVTIAPKDLDDEDVTIAYNPAAALVYTGAAQGLNIADITVTWTGHDAPVATADFVISGYDDNINAGTHTCTLAPGTSGNFKDGSFEFTIGQKSIADASVVVTPADVVYKGRTITQADLVNAGLTIKDGTLPNLLPSTAEEANDFSLTTEAINVNAGTTTSTVTITGSGNYKGTTTANFKVTPAELTVNAKPYTVARGTAVTNDNLIAGNYYEITGWVGDDAEADPKPAVTGAPTMGIAEGKNTNTAGIVPNAIEVKTTGNLAADNYSFVIGAAADLNVEATHFTAAFKNDIAYYYKDKWQIPANLEATKAYFDISVPVAITDMTIALFDGEDPVADDTELTVGKTYTLKVISKTISEDYALDGDGEIANKDVTVQKLPIKIIAKAQNIAYPAGAASLAKNADKVGEDFTSWNTDLVTIADAEGTEFGKGDFKTKYGVWTEDFVESLTWDVEGDKKPTNPGVITANLKADVATADATKNFEIIPTDGGLVTWTGVENDIELVRVSRTNFADAEVAAKIAEYDGSKNITVTIKYADNATFNTFKAGQWYAMVLPFETDAKQISTAFDYAIVDLLKESNDDPNRTYFSLHMNDTKIPANTPFIIKAWKNIDMANTGVTFANVNIEAPSAKNGNLVAADAAGNQFIGTYTGINGGFGGAGSKDYWYSLTNGELKQPSSSAYLRQLSAYIKLAPEADLDAHKFVIEDIDGTTTEISAIGVETKSDGQGIYNLNGMKMNGVPVQKGVYIQNGKKVVIK